MSAVGAKRPHKSLDEIVSNLGSNAVPARSGRKVKLLRAAAIVTGPAKPAAKPAKATAGKAKKAKSSKAEILAASGGLTLSDSSQVT